MHFKRCEDGGELLQQVPLIGREQVLGVGPWKEEGELERDRDRVEPEGQNDFDLAFFGLEADDRRPALNTEPDQHDCDGDERMAESTVPTPEKDQSMEVDPPTHVRLEVHAYARTKRGELALDAAILIAEIIAPNSSRAVSRLRVVCDDDGNCEVMAFDQSTMSWCVSKHSRVCSQDMLESLEEVNLLSKDHVDILLFDYPTKGDRIRLYVPHFFHHVTRDVGSDGRRGSSWRCPSRSRSPK